MKDSNAKWGAPAHLFSSSSFWGPTRPYTNSPLCRLMVLESTTVWHPPWHIHHSGVRQAPQQHSQGLANFRQARAAHGHLDDMGRAGW